MRREAVFLLLGGLFVVLSGSGCGTIVCGTHQDIHVASEPSGIEVKVETGASIQTPGDINLKRNKKHTLTATYPGAEPQVVELRSGVNGWFFGNIILGGLIGMGVDAVTGGYAKLTPTDIYFDFTEAGQARMKAKMEYIKSHPDLKKNIRLAIMDERPRPGMTEEQLVAALGEPDRIDSKKKLQVYVYEKRTPSQYHIRKGAIYKIVK